MSDWLPVSNPDLQPVEQPVEMVMAMDRDQPSLTDSGQGLLH